MGERLSKTARASLRTETTGNVSRTPLAWVFQHRIGKMQYKPYATCYVKGEAEAIVAQDPENLYVVSFDERRK